MDFKNAYLTYKISRVIFGFVLLSFFIFFPDNYAEYKNIILILIVYNLSVILSLFGGTGKITIVDFLLDVVFISALIYLDFNTLNYLAVMYLFPVFAYSFLTGKKDSYILSGLILLFYIYAVYTYSSLSFEGLVNILLVGFSILIMNYAGINLHARIQEQKRYISMLEEEKRQNEIFQRIYRISADFAHELRNPMTSLLAAIDLIDDENHRKKMVSIVKSEGRRIENLLNTFLTFSKPVDKNFTDINLRTLIAEILQQLDTNSKNISINVNKSINLYSSKEALKLILKNIIENAVYWAKNNIVINAYQKGDKVFIEIEDDGKGVDPEETEKIFEPFFTSRQEGTGLGLAIAKKYIIELGGNIKVEKSKLGGAKFVLWLPLGYKG